MKCKDCNVTNWDLDYYKSFYDWVKNSVFRYIIDEWDNEFVKESR